MNKITLPSAGAQTLPFFELGLWLGAVLRRRWRALVTRRAQRLAAARLRSLSHAQLKDMGISHGQIELAVRGMDVRGELVGNRHRPTS